MNKLKLSKKAKVLISILVPLAIIVLGGLGYYLWSDKNITIDNGSIDVEEGESSTNQNKEGQVVEVEKSNLFTKPYEYIHINKGQEQVIRVKKYNTPIMWENYLFYTNLETDESSIPTNVSVISYNLKTGERKNLFDKNKREDLVVDDPKNFRGYGSSGWLKIIDGDLYFFLGGYLQKGAIFYTNLNNISEMQKIMEGANPSIEEIEGKYWIKGGEGDACWSYQEYHSFDIKSKQSEPVYSYDSGCSEGEQMITIEKNRFILGHYSNDNNQWQTHDRKIEYVYSIGFDDPSQENVLISGDQMPGFSPYVFYHKNKLVFAGKDGIYVFNMKSNKFEETISYPVELRTGLLENYGRIKHLEEVGKILMIGDASAYVFSIEKESFDKVLDIPTEFTGEPKIIKYFEKSNQLIINTGESIYSFNLRSNKLNKITDLPSGFDIMLSENKLRRVRYSEERNQLFMIGNLAYIYDIRSDKFIMEIDLTNRLKETMRSGYLYIEDWVDDIVCIETRVPHDRYDFINLIYVDDGAIEVVGYTSSCPVSNDKNSYQYRINELAEKLKSYPEYELVYEG